MLAPFVVSLLLSLAYSTDAQPLAGTGGATSSATTVQTCAGTFDLTTLPPISWTDLPNIGSFSSS